MTALSLGDGKPRATWTPSDPWYFLVLLARQRKLLLLSALADAMALLLLSLRYDVSAKLVLQFGREKLVVAREILWGMGRDQQDAEVADATRVPPSLVSARHG